MPPPTESQAGKHEKNPIYPGLLMEPGSSIDLLDQLIVDGDHPRMPFPEQKETPLTQTERAKMYFDREGTFVQTEKSPAGVLTQNPDKQLDISIASAEDLRDIVPSGYEFSIYEKGKTWTLKSVTTHPRTGEWHEIKNGEMQREPLKLEAGDYSIANPAIPRDKRPTFPNETLGKMLYRAAEHEVDYHPGKEPLIYVDPATQTAILLVPQFDDEERRTVPKIYKTYDISTGKNGLGNVYGSGKTPPGYLEIERWNGAGQSLNTRLSNGKKAGYVDVLHAEEPGESKGKDPIVARRAVLRGLEPGNKNAKARKILLHGTADEKSVGPKFESENLSVVEGSESTGHKGESYGCVRFAGLPIADLLNRAPAGTKIFVNDTRYNGVNSVLPDDSGQQVYYASDKPRPSI